MYPGKPCLLCHKAFTVAVDCPVDQWSECGDDYRASKQHVADILDVIAAVNYARDFVVPTLQRRAPTELEAETVATTYMDRVRT